VREPGTGTPPGKAHGVRRQDATAEDAIDRNQPVPPPGVYAYTIP
jgi:hypothetical protein